MWHDTAWRSRSASTRKSVPTENQRCRPRPRATPSRMHPASWRPLPTPAPACESIDHGICAPWKMNAIRALARAVAQEESRADAVRDDGVAPRRAQRALELQRRQRARVRAGLERRARVDVDEGGRGDRRQQHGLADLARVHAGVC